MMTPDMGSWNSWSVQSSGNIDRNKASILGRECPRSGCPLGPRRCLFDPGGGGRGLAVGCPHFGGSVLGCIEADVCD